MQGDAHCTMDSVGPQQTGPLGPRLAVEPLSLAAIERFVADADDSVLFVEPRILRRVILQDRRITGLGIHVAHSHVYTIDRERLLMIVDRQELDLSPAAELPPHVILIPRPNEDEQFSRLDSAQRLRFFWRLVFHGRVHAILDTAFRTERLSSGEVTMRVQRLGEAEWAEIRSVLHQDELLLPPEQSMETYCEFVAVALELKYFALSDRPFFFPTIRDWESVDELIGREIPHARLYEATRPRGAAETTEASSPAALVAQGQKSSGATVGHRLLVARAEASARRGNDVRAAILQMEAAEAGDEGQASAARTEAEQHLMRLCGRLKSVWKLSDDRAEAWRQALWPLLAIIGQGYRTMEARLLYDLQKACIAAERGVYRINLWKWIRTFGKVPLRRDLPLLRRVVNVKSLRTAMKRVRTLLISPEERDTLRTMLEHQLERSEEQVRDEMRPTIETILTQVGLTADNLPEDIARRKIVEELLDSIVERGFAGMGDLRDAISRNDLKLPDVSGVLEPLLGDKLLRADTLLGRRLDGVYRTGPVYLRWPQRLSSLAFGTKVGRFLTEFVVLPFGVAFIALEAIKHVINMFDGPPPLTPELKTQVAELVKSGVKEVAAIAQVTHHHHPPNGPIFYLSVVLLGTFLLLLQQNERFRDKVVNSLKSTFKFVKWMLFDLPGKVIKAPIVQAVLQSPLYRVFRSYVLRPAIATAIFTGLAWLAAPLWSRRTIFEVFLATNLFLNSPIGRYFEEWLTDLFVRAWHELRMRVFAATFYWIMDTFHRLMRGLEQVIYIVDEWLQFRSGDPRQFILVKALLGMAWGVVSYVIRAYVTLLIEPQINPVKHFPVVTVTHKLMLPFSIVMINLITEYLQPFMGKYLANTFAVVNVFLLPGVFGFLVWELKGNWQLYAANRSRSLYPARVGHHGETVVGFVRPGFHSGTLPKLFAKLRNEMRVTGDRNHDRNVERYREGIESVELSMRRFVTRSLCQILRLDGGAAFEHVRVTSIDVATNRIAFALCFDPPAEVQDNQGESSRVLWIEMEDLGGWLCARTMETTWLPSLSMEVRERLNLALAGFYKLAGVELVHEHLDPMLSGSGVWKEFTPQALIVHDRSRTGDAATYSLVSEDDVILPQRGSENGHPAWPILTRRDAIFDDSSIAWSDWVSAWSHQPDKVWSDRFPHVLPGRQGAWPT
jgi:hypothetical protein